jgi:hypothetical protein
LLRDSPSLPPSATGQAQNLSVRTNNEKESPKVIEVWKDSAEFGPQLQETITEAEAAKRFNVANILPNQEIITFQGEHYHYYIKKESTNE